MGAVLNPADSAATRQSFVEPAPRRPPDPELVLPPSTSYEKMIGAGVAIDHTLAKIATVPHPGPE